MLTRRQLLFQHVSHNNLIQQQFSSTTIRSIMTTSKRSAITASKTATLQGHNQSWNTKTDISQSLTKSIPLYNNESYHKKIKIKINALITNTFSVQLYKRKRQSISRTLLLLFALLLFELLGVNADVCDQIRTLQKLLLHVVPNLLGESDEILGNLATDGSSS
eukprot:m.12995 g.12995  ORF g.12995 m.12995 type:complete len:163 (+) comp7121_c1_seq1:114-602(+)